jgi:hydrogenase maturation protein HypF
LPGMASAMWGGETLAGRPGRWTRVGRMRSFRLPGGDRAGREPWRSAAAICWETGLEWDGPPDTDWQLAREAWRRGMNAPVTTAVGRLFDAAASLAGLVHTASFEGQGPMQLEAIADPECLSTIPLPLQKQGGMWVSDWAPLIEPLRNPILPVGQRAAIFHNSLAATLIEQAQAVCRDTGARRVALTGGVFQNHMLVERVTSGLGRHDIRVDVDECLPVNDGSLCAGQVVEYAASEREAGSTGRVPRE